MQRRLTILLAFTALCTLGQPSGVVAANLVPAKKIPSRIVAVGDVHGDLEGLTQILRRAGLIDSTSQWIGGDSTLVMTGDLLDRGTHDRQVLDVLMALEKQARKSKGAVEVTLGNHEIMNITGDLRYVSEEAYLGFSDEKSERRRQQALKDFMRYRTQRATLLGKELTEFGPEEQSKWLQAHPLGYLEHREAYGPRGKYGRWLRKRPAILQISDTVFLHGGLNEKLRISTKQINEIVESELSAYDQFREYFTKTQLILPFFDLSEASAAVVSEVEHLQHRPEAVDKLPEREQLHLQTCEKFLRFVNWMSFHPDGPFWFRGFAEWTEDEGSLYAARLSEVFEAQHFVVGHTAQLPRKIRSRFGGRVFLIDTGMLQDYFDGGGPSALEIENGRFTALYLDGEELLWDSSLTPVAAR